MPGPRSVTPVLPTCTMSWVQDTFWEPPLGLHRRVPCGRRWREEEAEGETEAIGPTVGIAGAKGIRVQPPSPGLCPAPTFSTLQTPPDYRTETVEEARKVEGAGRPANTVSPAMKADKGGQGGRRDTEAGRVGEWAGGAVPP